MSAIFWLVFLFILARSIWRLMERAGAKGKFDGPLGRPLPGMGRPTSDSEEKPRLNIPEYLTRRSEEQPAELTRKKKDMETEPVKQYYEPAVLAGETAETCPRAPVYSYPKGTLKGSTARVSSGLESKKGSPDRIRRARGEQEDPFSDMLRPGQMVKGVAWSMILGPRGGLRPKR